MPATFATAVSEMTVRPATGQRQVGGQPGHRGRCGLRILVFHEALPLLFVTTLVPASDKVAGCPGEGLPGTAVPLRGNRVDTRHA